MTLEFKVIDTKTNEDVTELFLGHGYYLFQEEWTKGLLDPIATEKVWWTLDQFGQLYLMDASGEYKEADNNRFKVCISENS